MRLLWVLLCWLLTGVAAPAAIGADAVETAGDVLQFALPAAAAGATLYHRDRDGVVQLAASGVTSTAVMLTLKYSLDTTRPNGGSHSFPSGHTSISFTAAEFLRKRYGWEYGVPAYALASFVAYSRVESRQHYERDVIAGAAIGVASSYLFTRPYQGVTVQPVADSGFWGLRLSRAW